MISQSGHEAIIRAVQKFSDCGLSKIAFLGIDKAYHPGHIDRKIYECAMTLAGLDYRLSSHLDLSEKSSFQATLDMLQANDAPQAIFVGDDRLLAGMKEAVAGRGVVPGKDIAVITVSNSDKGSRIRTDWSSLDFNKDQVGAIAANELMKLLLTAGSEVRSISLLGKWRLRSTHMLQN
jgi:DNA-binding LacI/PurR family transcriptional regulator